MSSSIRRSARSLLTCACAVSTATIRNGPAIAGYTAETIASTAIGAALNGRQNLAFANGPVSTISLYQSDRVVDHGAVRGEDLSGLQRSHARQRAEIRDEVAAACARHHDGAALDQQVGAKQRARVGMPQAEVVRRHGRACEGPRARRLRRSRSGHRSRRSMARGSARRPPATATS